MVRFEFKILLKEVADYWCLRGGKKFELIRKNFSRKHAPGRWRGQIQISDIIGRSD